MKRRLKLTDHKISNVALKTIGVAAGVGAAVISLINLPDLVRYLRIRRM